MGLLRHFNVLAALAVFAVLGLSAGCVSAPAVKKDNTFHGKQVTGARSEVYVVADLEVAERKVMGKAWGDNLNKAEVEEAAVANAFSRDPAGPNSADVLVAPVFFYEYNLDNGTVTVTVVGYPARYKNFRPDPKLENNTALFMEPAGGQREKDGGKISESPAPVGTPQPAYQAPAPVSTPQPAYQAPAAEQAPASEPPRPAYKMPSPISVPQPVIEQTPVTNTPKEQ